MREADLRERAARVIPNGMYGHQSTMLLPDGYPQFFSRASGATLWDVEDRPYLDYLCGYGPNLLGYGRAEVDDAYTAQMRQGDTMTGPAAVMVELAEALTDTVDHADWALFCKNGTDATTMAAMVARAHTKQPAILLAEGAYHGAAPWCTPVRNGVTDADRANQIFYRYNDVESLEAAVAQAGGKFAAIFASPFKHDVFVDQELPDAAYARRARELCDEHGALLVIDDIRAGFRLARDSSWSLVNVNPDLSCWGKAIANGHALSALLGSERARAAASTIYATGSFWFSAAPMAASLATLKIIRESDYLERIDALGHRLRSGLDRVAAVHGFGLRQSGPSSMPLVIVADDPGFGLTYAWNAALLRRGVYFHPWHNMFLCAAMTEADIDRTVDAADEAFAELRRTAPPPIAEKVRLMREFAA